MGTLYLVATPIGNLEDITLRALRVLKEVRLIAAEDTRRTRILLARYGISTPMTSYFEHNKLAKIPLIMDALQSSDVALVSEAGMPGLSDPGYELVRAAIDAGFQVVPVPGPSAVVTALAASGLPTDRFIFLGFLPRKAGERQKFLESIAHQPHTLVAFEAPHRLLESLRDIAEILGDRKMAMARELTKIHEEIRRGKVSEILARYQKTEPRGECVLIVEGAAEETWDEGRIRQALLQLKEEGVAAKEATAQVASLSRHPRREVYKIWLTLEGDKEKR